MRPTLRLLVGPAVRSCSSVTAMVFAFGPACHDERLGAGDDFHDLLGDVRLALAVELQRQVVDDLRRVLGGVAHGGHARAVLGRGRLQQRAVDRDLHVVGHQPREDVPGLGLVLGERGVPGLLAWSLGEVLLHLRGLGHGRLLQRQQHLAPDLLRERRDVAVVEDLDAVELPVGVRRRRRRRRSRGRWRRPGGPCGRCTRPWPRGRGRSATTRRGARRRTRRPSGPRARARPPRGWRRA